MADQTCPVCGRSVMDVRGPYESKKDGYSQFKTHVHEKDDLGAFKEITDSCVEDIE